VKVYVLSEVLQDCWDQKGVFATLALAQAQVPHAEWTEDLEYDNKQCDPRAWTGWIGSQLNPGAFEYDITEWELCGEVSENGTGSGADTNEPR
jgi:hypothetical protein